MRKIKFRAKASVSDMLLDIKMGDWVFGCYIASDCNLPSIILEDGNQIEIDQNTLGQFVGLKDINDLEIYEGDIFETEVCLSPDGISDDHENFHWITVNCKIEFDNGSFFGRWGIFNYESASGQWTFNKKGKIDLNRKIEIIKEAA